MVLPALLRHLVAVTLAIPGFRVSADIPAAWLSLMTDQPPQYK